MIKYCCLLCNYLYFKNNFNIYCGLRLMRKNRITQRSMGKFMMNFIMKGKTMLGDFGINVLLLHYSDLMLGTAPDKSCTIFIAKNYVVMVRIILKMLVYFFGDL